ncbi:MAG: ABC transporter, partial [Sulfuriferula sp.]
MTSIQFMPPDFWLGDIATVLIGTEKVLAWVELDLDARLQFSQGIIVVTNQRILSRSTETSPWDSWTFYAGLMLVHHDHAGVGTLELRDAKNRLTRWRYTLARNVAALRLIAEFELQLASHQSGQPATREMVALCPNCKAVLEPGQDECVVCAKTTHVSPSTWTLFRLWRFAKP